jgi:hypothetical protein
MARLRVLLAVAVLAVTAAAPVVAAAAAAPNPVADCDSSGTLTHRYSAAVLEHALATMPADIKEYTDCPDVIQRALLAKLGGHHTGANKDSSGSGGSFLPTPVIVAFVLLLVAGATFGVLAMRRRTPPGGPGSP